MQLFCNTVFILTVLFAVNNMLSLFLCIHYSISTTKSDRHFLFTFISYDCIHFTVILFWLPWIIVCCGLCGMCGIHFPWKLTANFVFAQTHHFATSSMISCEPPRTPSRSKAHIEAHSSNCFKATRTHTHISKHAQLKVNHERYASPCSIWASF